jgi:hypothetical protein
MKPNPFMALSRTPSEHFRLCLYGAVLNLIEKTAEVCGSFAKAFEEHPFLVDYNNELAQHALEGMQQGEAGGFWRRSLSEWEESDATHLPIKALTETSNFDYGTVMLLMSIGLVEEDAQFGAVFAQLQGGRGQTRPTTGGLGLLCSCFFDLEDIHAPIRSLQNLGLIQCCNPDAPWPELTFRVQGVLWEVIRGETPGSIVPGMIHRDIDSLLELDALTLPDSLRQNAHRICGLLRDEPMRAILVQGPQHNGRRTLLGSIARALGVGVMELTSAGGAADDSWRLIGPLSTLYHAMPVIVIDSAHTDVVEIPRLQGYAGPIGLVLGKHAGVNGPGVVDGLTVRLEIPDIEARREHWRAVLGERPGDLVPALAERMRLTGGNIRRIAEFARSSATMRNHTEVDWEDIRCGRSALNRHSLDSLAAGVKVTGDWSCLAVSARTFQELRHLENRCRFREQLQTVVGPALVPQVNVGVRALFCGPSGTGKTLAARLLAAALQMDMYRIDLSAVVNKYIGETEKNLNQVFSRAEELDVLLLLDEGDALLARRTAVQTANDRYANLETNYLLQRIESFEGILVVTTNAIEHVDRAFQRRMDVVIDFPLPDASERWSIWHMHLPVQHAVDGEFLQEVSNRCSLTGGQIRNAALHASLLALSNGGTVTSEFVEAAVQREYRKTGAICPLRRTNALSLLPK